MSTAPTRATRVTAGLLVLVTIALATWVIARPGVYWASQQVILIAPPIATRPNTLQDGSSSLVALAGVVERQVSGQSDKLKPNGAQVSIVDRGITNGVTVRVPDYGGQWAHNFSQPVLDVQASGSTPQLVEQRINSTVTEIVRLIENDQANLAVRSRVQITTKTSPQTLQIRYERGSRGIALIIVLLLGSVSTTVVIITRKNRQFTTSLPVGAPA